MVYLGRVRWTREPRTNLTFVDRGEGQQGWIKQKNGEWVFSSHSRSEWTAVHLREIVEKMETLEVAE